MDSIKQYWEQVDEFYDSITPKCESVKNLEEKIKFPARYILMAITALIFIIFFFLTRKCGFFTYLIFVPALVASMMSIHQKKNEEKKWASFWLLFSFLHLLPTCIRSNLYYSIIECIVLYYFAFFDSCDIIAQGLEIAYNYITDAFEKYKKFCAEKKE